MITIAPLLDPEVSRIHACLLDTAWSLAFFGDYHSPEEAQARVAAWLANDPQSFSIFSVRDADEWSGFFYVERRTFLSTPLCRATLSGGVAPARVGSGFGVRVCRATLDFVTATFRVHKVETAVLCHNVPSFRVLQHCGFQEEGRSVAHFHTRALGFVDVRYLARHFSEP
jgi:RimJ/RimL family protein N-acetyltransferase